MRDSLPTFRGTKPSLPNTCASCGSNWTAGCWRRGWNNAENNSVNLCNRCGLKFRAGKLELPPQSTSADTLHVIKAELDRHSVIPVIATTESMTVPTEIHGGSMEKEIGEFVAYSMIRESDKGTSKRVLFYLHDQNGASKLAITGVDSRGTGHFVYESEEGMSPPLKCTNRAGVMAWLSDLGITSQLDKSDPSSIQTNKRLINRSPTRPRLDRDYIDYHEESGNDGSIAFENFHLVDSNGEEVLAVLGSMVDDSCVYRCVIEGQTMTFEDRHEVLAWLDWIIGKSEMPPPRLIKKDLRKSSRKRDVSPNKTSEPSSSKRRITNLTIEDMKVIFGDTDLMRWVLRKPSSEELETFQQWKETLCREKIPCDDDTQSGFIEAGEALQILQTLQKHETCLKLLEETSIGRPISRLTNHPDKEVANLASEISLKWNEWTNQALAKATAARNN